MILWWLGLGSWGDPLPSISPCSTQLLNVLSLNSISSIMVREAPIPGLGSSEVLMLIRFIGIYVWRESKTIGRKCNNSLVINL